jgi:outer membrane protein
MKNLIKVALIVAGLSLSGSIVNAQQKFAHINSQALLESMPEMKAADATLGTYQKTLQTQLESMAAEREKKYTLANEKAKNRSEANKDAVDKELQTLGTELDDLTKRINDADQKAQQDYKTKSDELFSPIITKATNAVNAVAKEKGYAYVFDVSQPSVIYFGGGDDILAAVQAKLGITASVSPAPAVKTPAK